MRGDTRGDQRTAREEGGSSAVAAQQGSGRKAAAAREEEGVGEGGAMGEAADLEALQRKLIGPTPGKEKEEDALARLQKMLLPDVEVGTNTRAQEPQHKKQQATKHSAPPPPPPQQPPPPPQQQPPPPPPPHLQPPQPPQQALPQQQQKQLLSQFLLQVQQLLPQLAGLPEAQPMAEYIEQVKIQQKLQANLEAMAAKEEEVRALKAEQDRLAARLTTLGFADAKLASD